MTREERKRIQGAAATILARAIRHGQMKRPAEFLCTDCGGKADRYDHRDYTRPLQVDPVCRSCNARRGPALVWASATTAQD
jgi:hypothetical protein